MVLSELLPPVPPPPPFSVCCSLFSELPLCFSKSFNKLLEVVGVVVGVVFEFVLRMFLIVSMVFGRPDSVESDPTPDSPLMSRDAGFSGVFGELPWEPDEIVRWAADGWVWDEDVGVVGC